MYPEGAGVVAGLLRFGVGEIAVGFVGVSGTSVERFADSAVSGGVFVGCAGGGCRPAIGRRPAQPEPRAIKNNVVETKQRTGRSLRALSEGVCLFREFRSLRDLLGDFFKGPPVFRT